MTDKINELLVNKIVQQEKKKIILKLLLQVKSHLDINGSSFRLDCMLSVFPYTSFKLRYFTETYMIVNIIEYFSS